MNSEQDMKSESLSEEQRLGSREAQTEEGQAPTYRRVSRTQRPRIQPQRTYNAERTAYQGENDGFRPEGFGAGLQTTPPQRPYRPRYNQDEQSYQPRQGGYRPRYNQGEGYQPRQGGYRPRYNQDEQGYQPRQGGYRSHYNQGEGYQPRQGGYRPRYNQDEQSYQPRQGGYRPRYNQGEGYQPRQGYQSQGYRPRPGGYHPHPKVNNLKRRVEYKEDHVDPNEPMRLNKFLANAGVCSRREADDFIQAGVVKVNGEVVTEMGTKIMRTDEVMFHDRPVSLEKKVYVLLNKPKDYVTTSDDPQQRKTVMDLVRNACPERIYPVGRLDRTTTGVLLLTNDGDLASKLTHPKFLKKKIYHVYLDKNVTLHDLQQIREGIVLDDGEIHADAVEYASETDKKQVGIEIHSGRNRIVRRIFESLGYRVMKLDRVQFAGLTKKNVRRGDWRFLTEKEVDMLRMGAFE